MLTFTVKIKLRDEAEPRIMQATSCGIQPDFTCPVYYVRTVEGDQLEVPMDNIAYLEFGKDKYQ